MAKKTKINKNYNPIFNTGFWIGLLMIPVLIILEYVIGGNNAILSENFKRLYSSQMVSVIFLAIIGYIATIWVRSFE